MVDNLNKVRHGSSRHSGKKKKYLKAKIDELEYKCKIKNIRDLCIGISDYKKGFQPRTNIVRDKKDVLFTDSQSILVLWRNHFSQLLILHGVNDVRQIEIHTAEPLVPEPSALRL
jgi:hypothetical protein